MNLIWVEVSICSFFCLATGIKATQSHGFLSLALYLTYYTPLYLKQIITTSTQSLHQFFKCNCRPLYKAFQHSFSVHQDLNQKKNAHCDRHSVFRNTPQKNFVLFPHNTCKKQREKIMTQKSMQVFILSKALG